MSIPGFDAAQARYDSMLPEDPPIYRCPITHEMNEDCERHNEDGDSCPLPDDDEEWDGPYDTWKEWEIDHGDRFDYFD